MKISRSYLMGLGSGLILSALLAMIIPPVTINFGGNPPHQQGANQGERQGETNKDTQNGDKDQGESESLTGKDDKETGNEDENKPLEGNKENPSHDSDKDRDPDKETFVIPRGSTASQIANLLLNAGWISSKEEFIEIVREENLASKFQAGTFQLTRGMNIQEIIGELIK